MYNGLARSLDYSSLVGNGLVHIGIGMDLPHKRFVGLRPMWLADGQRVVRPAHGGWADVGMRERSGRTDTGVDKMKT